MHTWWLTASVLEKFFWFIAIPFSVILIIQIIHILFTMGGDQAETEITLPDTSGLDISIGSSIDMPAHDLPAFSAKKTINKIPDNSFKLFSISNLIAFLTFFGWVGIAGVRSHLSHVGTVIIAIIMGFIAMVIFTAVFYFIEKLSSTEEISNLISIGKNAKVLETIQAESKNIGKITIWQPKGFEEMPAINRGAEELIAGTIVKITDIQGNVAIVEKAG